MSANWLNNIKHVAPGEPVKAGVVGRPDQALDARTEYLRQRLDAAELGRAVFDTNATVAPSVLEGQPVFWNATAQRYEQAFAAVETDQVTGALVPQPSADCVGICAKKHSDSLADIVLYGLIRLPVLTNAIPGPISAGRYYLSAVTPGQLVKQRPGVTVSVCYVQGVKDNCADDPWVIVMPQMRDFLEDHIHYRFELAARPAGSHDPDAAAVAGVHTIDEPDASLPGWLPADHQVFNDKAPEGAKFGYNFSHDEALARVWPPMPLQAVAMLWDKGVDYVGATEIPLGVDDKLCVVNRDGIWWMKDCYGDVPWPADLNTVPTSESESSTSEASCPRTERMRVIVVFLRMLFGNDKSVVTSLKPAVDSPITIANCDGLRATQDKPLTGDLELGLDLELMEDPAEAFGGRAYKEITTGYKLKKGWVAEGLRVGYGPIVLNGTRDRALSTAEKTALGLPANSTSRLYQGIVTVNYDDQFVEREISPQIIRLSDVLERLYLDIPYLGFPEGQDSLVRVRLNIPAANLGETLEMKIRAQIFGRAGGVSTAVLLPPMQMFYRILPRPDGTTPLATSDTEITFDSEVSLNIDTPTEIESQAFSVSEGDTVLLTMSREGTGDSYDAEVGLLRLAGIVYVP
jgi:hypothetical protein